MDDEELLAWAEEALTETEVNQGLSDRHASVLAALRIRLKGSGGESLEDLLEAAERSRSGQPRAEVTETENRRKPTLDDLLGKEQAKRVALLGRGQTRRYPSRNARAPASAKRLS